MTKSCCLYLYSIEELYDRAAVTGLHTVVVLSFSQGRVSDTRYYRILIETRNAFFDLTG